jgi:hypothetical protein
MGLGNKFIDKWLSVYIYIYDEHENRIQYIYQNWDTLTDDWINDTKYDAFWSELDNSDIYETENYNLAVYPNPTSQKLTISADIPLKNTIVNIYSISGKLIKSEIPNALNEIDVSKLSAGTFLLKIYSEDGVIVKKFVKQ